MDSTEPTTPQWPNGDAVLVCLDLEAHCRNQTFKEYKAGIKRREHRVTEIGIACFDPKAVRFDAAGDRGKNTWKAIKARHFAIEEHRHVAPHAPYCKKVDTDTFNFGETRTVRKAQTKNAVVGQNSKLSRRPWGVEPPDAIPQPTSGCVSLL